MVGDKESFTGAIEVKVAGQIAVHSTSSGNSLLYTALYLIIQFQTTHYIPRNVCSKMINNYHMFE